jgi:CRISPR-associated protein (TIGR02584 family)
MNESKFKEILIFVAGTTPQIITETIYALIHQAPPVYPDEIHVITTTQGKNLIKENLIDSGRFREFCREFNMQENILDENSILVVKGKNADYLDDIKEAKDNESLGDFITNFIKDKTFDGKTRLHCSLAGGRKTMSFYIGSALQLFGRPWDKLYHVLVTPEFESNPDFYYKPKKNKVLTPLNPPLNKSHPLNPPLNKSHPFNPPLNKGGNGGLKPLNTKDAEIFLAELPFIRLRDKIPLNGKSFRKLVEEGQKEIDTALTQPFLKINLRERTVYIGDGTVDMVPLQLMIYTAYIRQKIDHCKYPENVYCLKCTDCFLPIVDLLSRPALEKMSRDYRTIYSIQPNRADDLLDKCKEGLRMEILRSNISKINRTIKEQLMNDTLLPYYSITAIKQYAGSRYGVRVEKGKIRIE